MRSRMARVHVAPDVDAVEGECRRPDERGQRGENRNSPAASRTSGFVLTKSMKAPPPVNTAADTARPVPRLSATTIRTALPEAPLIARPERLAADLLGGGGETVQEVAAEQEDVVSTALAASVRSPARAPWEVKNPNATSSVTVRIAMSRLTAACAAAARLRGPHPA